MIDIIHPVSGEHGYFCTNQEKEVIDAIISDFRSKHLVVTSADCRGGAYE